MTVDSHASLRRDGLEELIRAVTSFCDERAWEPFHTPNSLGTAIGIEAAESQEFFLWKSEQEATAEFLTLPPAHARMREELADILIHALLFAAAADIDPATPSRERLQANAAKNPVAKGRGKATKHTEIE